jgi:hypothetical protein
MASQRSSATREPANQQDQGLGVIDLVTKISGFI